MLRNKAFIQRCHCSQISKDEVAKIVAGFENESLLTSGGVTIAGARYIYLSGTDRIIRAKLGKVGVHCMKTQQGEIAPVFYGKCIFVDFLLFHNINLQGKLFFLFVSFTEEVCFCRSCL